MNRLLVPCFLALLTACSGGGSGNALPQMPRIDTFTATPSDLPAGGGSVTLAWEVNGASSLSIDVGVGSVTPADRGSTSVNVTANKTFTLTATNATGSITRAVSVTVAVGPSITLSPTSRAFVAGNPGGVFDAVVTDSSAEVDWTLSGPGSLSANSGPSIVYTPPASVAAPSTATLTATLAGTGLSATAAVSISPMVLTGGVLFYKADGSGAVVVLAVTGQVTPVKTFAAGDLPAGVTHFGKPYGRYDLLYNATDGSGALGNFDGTGKFRTLRSYAPGDLPAHQTNVVSLYDRLVFYDAGTTLCGGYVSGYGLSGPVSQTGFATDWNLITRVNDASGVFFYREADGAAGYGTYDGDCNWKYLAAYPGTLKGFSQILLTPGGTLFYRASDGIGALETFDAAGVASLVGNYAPGTLGKDWEQVVSTTAGVLFYKGDGSAELGTFSGNTYSPVKAYAVGGLPAADLVTVVGN